MSFSVSLLHLSKIPSAGADLLLRAVVDFSSVVQHVLLFLSIVIHVHRVS